MNFETLGERKVSGVVISTSSIENKMSKLTYQIDFFPLELKYRLCYILHRIL